MFTEPAVAYLTDWSTLWGLHLIWITAALKIGICWRADAHLGGKRPSPRA